ncbi:MAG TPA: hypothetical protein VJ963_04795 [Bacteroidales bacterium]|nr:hypothetical protein [Bacteroidales bacterium]
MKQKIIIGFAVALLLLTVYMIARDLIHGSASFTKSTCCGDDYTDLKKIDTSLVDYFQSGTVETGLNGLTGIAVGEDGYIYTCGNKTITVFDTSGSVSSSFPVDNRATCIAIGEKGIYVGQGPSVSVYSFRGLKEQEMKPYNPRGYITSVAVNGSFVYLADAVSKRILKYSTDGKLEQVIGAKDSITGNPGFVIPSMYFDIAFGSFNDLWAVNPGRLQIENYTTSGYMQSEWGKASFENGGFTGCCNPAHIALLPNGNFVTYEKGIDKIKVFDPTGTFVCLVAGAGSFKGNTDFQLGNNNLIKDIAAGNDGRIYVLDAYNQIVIFRKKDK